LPDRPVVSSQALPVVARRDLVHVGQVDLVVGLDRVAQLDLGPLHLGDLGLEVDDGFGVGGGVLVAGQRQHLLDVLLVLGLGLGQLGVVRLQVVVAVRHAQAALADVGHVLGRILVVLVDAEVEGHADADLAQAGQQRRQLGLVLQRGDLVQFTLQRRAPSCSRRASSMKLA
jgi:hypothetical protein